MFHFICGYVAYLEAGMVALENNGIAYEIYVPEGSSALLANIGEEITLYTAMQVREDDISLYGFTDRESLALFRLLQTVSGVGAKAALSLIGAFPSPSELKRAIYFEDTAALTRANGVGKKLAQRVILELKDKFGDLSYSEQFSKASNVVVKGSARDEALQALIVLGYSRTEALSFMSGVEGEDLSAEDIIKQALRMRR